MRDRVQPYWFFDGCCKVYLIRKPIPWAGFSSASTMTTSQQGPQLWHFGILASSWAEGSPFLLYIMVQRLQCALRLVRLHIGNYTFSELFEFSSIGISEVYCCAACGAHFAQYKVRSLHTVCVTRLLQLRRVLQDLLSTNFRGRHAKPVKCAVHGTSNRLKTAGQAMHCSSTK